MCSVTIPVTLYKLENRKMAEMAAFIDSGATICCIDLHLIQRVKWLLEKLTKPMYARNANRTTNSRGMICHQVTLSLQIKGRNLTQTFYIVNLGGWDNIILRYPWLTKNNPWINWEKGEVKIPGTPVPRHDNPKVVEQRYLLRYIGACEKEKLTYAATLCRQQKQREHCVQVLGVDHPYIWEVTLSTSLAQVVQKAKQQLPPQYTKYAKVFNEPKAGKLPP